MKQRFTGLRLAALLVCLAGATTTQAHDTWFEPRPAGLALGTGDRFPRLEFTVSAEHLERHGCAAREAGKLAEPRPALSLAAPLQMQRSEPTALVLALPAQPDSSCWAELVPFDIEIAPDKVPLYLNEISASPALRAAWAAEQAAGRPWRERYAKHARVELGTMLAPTQPVAMGMDVLLAAGVPKVGNEVTFTVLKAGQPLVGQPMELVSEHSRIGIWRRTDAKGQISSRLPFAGRWVVRGTELRAPVEPGARWTSDFVTLAFSVGG